MKILIVMEGFFPGKKYGGPPVSVDNFCSLMKEFDCYIVTLNHDMGETKPYDSIQQGWNNRINSKVRYLSDTEYNIVTFENIIKEIQPDFLYLQGLFQSCILPCLKLSKKYGLKVILAPRGELCKGAFRHKLYKKVPYVMFLRVFGLLSNVSFQSTSDEETKAIRNILGASRDRIYHLANIPSIPNTEYDYLKKEVGSARIVFLSRIMWKKNLLFAIKSLEKVIGKVQFDIYGMIEQEKYWEKCKDAISELPKNIKVNYCGLLDHDDVHKSLSQYDAFLFPTLSENFGHVIAESLIVGCPVIISNQTPFTDVNEKGAGWAISLDNIENFTDAVQTIVDCDNDKRDLYYLHSKKYIASKLDIITLKNVYYKVLTELVGI